LEFNIPFQHKYGYIRDPGFVALYDIRPGNGMGLLLQPVTGKSTQT